MCIPGLFESTSQSARSAGQTHRKMKNNAFQNSLSSLSITAARIRDVKSIDSHKLECIVASIA